MRYILEYIHEEYKELVYLEQYRRRIATLKGHKNEIMGQ